MGYLLYAVVLLPIPVAAIVDVKTRRGFGLILLVLVAIALEIWAGLSIQQAIRESAGRDNLDVGIAAAFLLLAGLVINAGIAVGAVVVAAISRHRNWLIALIAALLAMPACLALGGSGSLPGTVMLPLALFLPLAASLAYAVRRSARPGPPAGPTSDWRVTRPDSAITS